MKQLLHNLLLLFLCPSIFSQPLRFEYDTVPVNSGFKMEGYWVWGGSMIKVGNTYHLFASRWPKVAAFPEGYRYSSEIVRATSRSPLGPFEFQEVVIGERDSIYWDSNMSHNPTIHKIGNKFVLFYIGSDFTTYEGKPGNLLRRIGYAEASSITGPWKRCDMPLIGMESNNPAILDEGTRIKMIFRDKDLRIYMAEANNYKGPYVIKNDNVWPDCRLEDFYLFRSNDAYHLICEDNVGKVSGHERWGVHLYSGDGIHDWKKYDPVVVYDHNILYENDSVLHCARRERPQLFISDHQIRYLLNSVYDGRNSWCQPVRLKNPVKLH